MKTNMLRSQLGGRVASGRPTASRVSHMSPVCVAASPPSSPGNSGEKQPPKLNIIEGSAWEDGIPAVMGAHLMPSGEVAPISVSKGPGLEMEPFMFKYPSADYAVEVLQYANAHAINKGFAKYVIGAAKAAIAEKDSFTLVLSGGSLVNMLGALADKEYKKEIDWSKWHIFWADERNVPLTSDDSNYKGAQKAFLSKTTIPEAQIYKITEGLTADQAATNYEGQLLEVPTTVLPRTEDGFPVFDMVLLGIGPDGHVASLFPNTRQTSATEGWVLGVENSPKPPPERITLTMPAINSAKDVAIVACGEGKREIVQRVLETQTLPGALPAQLVRPYTGTLKWILDVAAGQDLQIGDWEEKKAFPRSTV